MIKYLGTLAAIGGILFSLTACDKDADIVSRNISTDADNFKVNRRVIFYNGITGDYILSVEGLCSIGNYDANNRLSVTCKTGIDSYKKHFLGLSHNVTFFAEQTDPVKASPYFYKVIFKPSTIIPNIEVR